ncbi:MAG: DUF4331 domain-containing protein [Chloroflexota bacterium]|nr:DUF4331 domain-containing protein [Chloroflexota bacterium]
MTFKRKALTLGAVGLMAVTSVGGAAVASSHREAPGIAKDPTADITDVYAFVSPDRTDTVTIIGNWIPFQEPGGGPNFYPFDDTAHYFLRVDNNGDGVEDVEFVFEFETTFSNPDSFLYSGYGPIEDESDPQGAPFAQSNVEQTYTVLMDGAEIATGLSVPPDNIGPRTTPEYDSYAEDGIHELENGVTVFAGQRDDPFFADVASIFDLGGLRPFNEAHLLELPTEMGVDSLSAFNVKSIAVQIPINMLTNDGMDVSAPTDANAVVGIWGGTTRLATSVLNETGIPELSGEYVQVARLGNPLINEVIIPIGEKDLWNASMPADDAQFTDRYLNSELAAIINTLYSSALEEVDVTGRSDLMLILGQGVEGLNQTNTGDTLYDLLRLNMGIPPTDNPSRLGVLDGDLAGFPNGRRLWDDVVDIELRAVAQGYGEFLNENFELPNKSPNNMVGDGCDANDKAFLDEFPYVAAPHDGYEGGTYRNSPCEALDETSTN